MGSFFDDISTKADERRALSQDKLDRLLDQGIIASKARRDQGIANVASIPAGLFTGATGFFGDLEALGKGLYRSGATRNAIGQAQEGHVGALEEIANIYDTNDTLMPNSEGQRDYIKDKLKDTWYGDQVEQGDIGLLLGEILAPVPTVAGLGKTAKLVGNAVADTVGTGIKAERGMGLSKGIDQLLGMTQDPAMVIGPKSRNWSKASEDAFNKALPNKEAIINNRKATGTFSPVDAEAKVWEETAELGNPTFLDIDGVVKQEIPTGDFSVTTRYNNKNKPMKMVSDLNNPSLNTYDQLSNGINAKRGRPSNVHGVGYMNIPADKAVLNNNSLGTYNPNNNIMSVNPNKSKAIQKNTMAHEGQHAIQDIEKDFATGSWPELYKAKNLDDIYYSSDKAKSNAVKQLRANDMDNYTSDIQSTHLSLHDDPSGMGAYLRDPGEMLARATGDRVNLDKAGIKKNHILDTYEDMMWDNNGIMPNDVLDAKLNELLKANGGIPESNKFPKILDKALANPGNKEYRKYFKGLDIKEGSFKRELQPSGHSHLTFEMNDGRVGKLTNVPNTPDNDHNSLQNTLKYIRNGINRAGQDIDAGNGRAGGSFEWIQPQKKNNNVSYSMDIPSKPNTNPKTGYPMGTDDEIQIARDNYNSIRAKYRHKDNKLLTQAQKDETSQARKKLNELLGKSNKELNDAKINPIKLPEHTEFNGRRYSNKTGYEIGTDEEIIAARKAVAAVKQKTADIMNKPQKRLTPDDWKNSGTLDEFNAARQVLKKLRGEATEPPTYIKKVTDPDNQHYIVNQPWFKKLDSNVQQEYFDIKQQSRELTQQVADNSGKTTNKIRVTDKENAGLLSDFRDNGNRLHAWRMTHDGEAYVNHLLKAARQRAVKYNAIPKTQTPEDVKKIKAIYQEARDKTIKTGIPHEVDHIFPLQGKHHKGKHTPENLQVVPMQWNRAKRNVPDNNWTKLIYPKGLL